MRVISLRGTGENRKAAVPRWHLAFLTLMKFEPVCVDFVGVEMVSKQQKLYGDQEEDLINV